MTSQPSDHAARLARAQQALDGLSIGDAFGERFFCGPLALVRMLETRELPPGPWRWTDDTAMALALVEVLEAGAGLDLDRFAARLRARYDEAPWRGYGGGAHRLFEALGRGEGWSEAAGALFDGSGSFGNGAAMRVAPLGAYFADDLEVVVAEARRSALVTHAHQEGQAGAVAVAVAAAVAWQTRDASLASARQRVLEAVLDCTPPDTQVGERLVKARNLGLDASPQAAADRLGNGSSISAQDTAPFCVWSIASSLRDYEAGLWRTVSVLGDRDTTCAIVGGALALSAPDTVPDAWRQAREPLAGLPLERDLSGAAPG